MNADQPEDSLKKRYVYKLGTNLVNLALSLVTAGIAPRALGASAYGDFEYLTTAFFQKVVNIFDAGTSTCFYTKLSQRVHDTGLVRFYWGFALGMSGLILFFVLLALAGGWNGALWPDIPAVYVWLGLGWGLLTWYNQTIGKIVDATGQTVRRDVPICNGFWEPASAGDVLGHGLRSSRVFYHYAILIFFMRRLVAGLAAGRIFLFPRGRLKGAEIRNYSHEFYLYTAPLVVYEFAGSSFRFWNGGCCSGSAARRNRASTGCR